MSRKSQHRRWRERFRAAVLERAQGRCEVCGATGVPLDAHHITPRKQMPAGGYVRENGIALCSRPGGCHEEAEAYWAEGVALAMYFPAQLYLRIGSSHEKARAACERLAGEGGARCGGPEHCPHPCSECSVEAHHFCEALMESAEESPEHPAAKLGVEIWMPCRHCDGWLEVT